MADTFRLDILTPERTAFSGSCETLTVTLADGEASILKGHAPMLALLPAGRIKLKKDGAWRSYQILEGFIKVSDTGTEIFCPQCLRVTEK